MSDKEQFEVWAEKEGFDLSIRFFDKEDNNYEDPNTQLAYEIWIESRKALRAEIERLQELVEAFKNLAERRHEDTIEEHDEVLRLQGEVEIIRLLLAHSYSGINLYCDDGELQDNSKLPFIDFKNDPANEIHSKIILRTQEQLKEVKGE